MLVLDYCGKSLSPSLFCGVAAQRLGGLQASFVIVL